MNRLLHDLRIVEISAFVAAPLGGMTMAQMGADVIRIDPIGGGIDFRRWPVTKDGASLYWAGLNKAKRSLALGARQARGPRDRPRPGHRARPRRRHPAEQSATLAWSRFCQPQGRRAPM